jgi:Na+-translocating ferredoxin:NAD+ oxidoreductase RnfD subunit
MNIITRIKDPRYFQIAVLSSLLLFGVGVLDFGIHWYNAITILATAQIVQWLGTRALRLPRFDPLSALITSLSLTLLLRTELVTLAALAAVIAVGSKFVIRVNGRHVFNPANFALVTLMLATEHAWVSGGQWGSATIGALALSCLGFLVLTKAKRAETTIAFIAAYGLLVLGRAWWLGDPIAIPLHQLQNGALLIFAFFMISDPKTAPQSATARVLFAALVAGIAFSIQFVFYQANGPILALIMCAPLVPLFDKFLQGEKYDWRLPSRLQSQQDKGVL